MQHLRAWDWELASLVRGGRGEKEGASKWRSFGWEMESSEEIAGFVEWGGGGMFATRKGEE